MNKPRALDLFCGAGGASVGLAEVGFQVTGVDIVDQPGFMGGIAGAFIRADALDLPVKFMSRYDLIWASPPRRTYSSLRARYNVSEYIRLVHRLYEKLKSSEALWCIENVVSAPFPDIDLFPTHRLCGTGFGLKTTDGLTEIRRHRTVQTSWHPMSPPPACSHSLNTLSVSGHTPQTGKGRGSKVYGVADARAAMGIYWMPMRALSEAVPPAYARWVGRQAIHELTRLGRVPKKCICPTANELAAYADCQSDSWETGWIRAHLFECVACADDFDYITSTDSGSLV